MPKIHKNRYMLIDGNALVHRGFHAIPGLTTKTGEPTGAVYGFVSILLKAIKDLKPTHIACTFDLAGPTFRHKEYDDYKATRVKAAQELYDQIPRVKEVVRALNIPIFEKQGFEADDVLGTLANHICKENKGDCEVLIVTGDLDTLQLVNNCVKIYTLRKGLTDTAIYDEAAIKERYGLSPKQMIDYKALRGDPSDNIKGVKGIGEKGASELIQNFGSLKNLYQELKSKNSNLKTQIKPRTLQLLIEGEKDAELSYRLSTIICDVPIKIEIPAYEFIQKNLTAAVKIFQELEFRSLVDKLPKNYLPNKSKDKDKINETAVVSEEAKAVTLSKNFKQDYEFVNDEKKLENLLKKLVKAKYLAVDTESTSIDAIVAKLVGISLAFKDGEAYYIPANLVKQSKELQSILHSSEVKKIGHNIKYDLLVLQNEAIELKGIEFDTMIASYLLNAGSRQHSLDALSFNELGYQMQPIEDLIGKGKKQLTMDQVDPEKVSWYAAEDADITWRLKEVFEPRLQKQDLNSVFYNIEMPLVEVLADVERAGIKLDKELLLDLSEQAEKLINSLEKDIYKLAGKEFNIASPKQLQEILFTDLQISTDGGKKIKTGISTAAGQLEKMVGLHPIIEKIMQYREITKLQSTYLLSLPELVNNNTGRIHTSYNQTIAATGRLSSTDPNLQNIPVRGTGLGAQIRRAFVAEKGNKLVSLDYSQIELRIVAHLAADKTMKEIFKNDQDIHTNTAMAIFGLPEPQLTPDMRRDAKTINFGVLYGLSSFGLSSRIGEVSWSDAKEFIEKYFKAYPQVKEYIEAIKQEVREQGYVKNELGRIRNFPEIKSSQFFIRAAAERAAVNFPIQSLAADVIKVAMINIHKELKGKSHEIKMLLQVHDELVFEIKEDKVEKYVKMLKSMMEEAVKLSVPIKVEAKVGNNWGEMEKL